MTQDYERIARAIDFIRQHVGHQPSLAEIAAHVHLSEFHFQRLFSRCQTLLAGLNPRAGKTIIAAAVPLDLKCQL